ncbi:MAG: hypothetical protein ACSLE1_03025 [Sphingobium sp.]
MTHTAADERAAIVKWLLREAGKDRADLSRLHASLKLNNVMTAEWETLIQTKIGIADAILHGDHINHDGGV